MFFEIPFPFLETQEYTIKVDSTQNNDQTYIMKQQNNGPIYDTSPNQPLPQPMSAPVPPPPPPPPPPGPSQAPPGPSARAVGKSFDFYY